MYRIKESALVTSKRKFQEQILHLRHQPLGIILLMLLKSIFEKQHIYFEKDTQREVLRELRKDGATVRQLQKLTGIGRGLIQRLK